MAFKFGLFLLSIMGYLGVIVKKGRFQPEFAPAICFAGISNLLFLAGILNIMKLTVWMIFIGGFICVCWLFWKPISFSLRERWLGIGMFLFILYFSWLLWGVGCVSYDDFSHWATVVKAMLLNDRMPNFQDTVVMFQSYPLGSSLFLYYVCRIVGTTEACMLWAQVLLLLGFGVSVLAFTRKNNWYGIAIGIGFGFYALVMNTTIYSLHVDTLLSIVGVAGFAVIYAYRKEPTKGFAGVSGIMMFLVNIKNSGVFFYGILLAFVFFYQIQNGKLNRKGIFLGPVCIPILSMILWKRHIALVFAAGASTKHAMSIENYQRIWEQKSGEVVKEVTDKLVKAFFAVKEEGVPPQGTALKMMLLVLLILLIAWWISGELRSRSQWKNLFFSYVSLWGIVLLYQISLWGMYLFSMPNNEALVLASYERYTRTSMLFVFGISLIWALDKIKIMEIFKKGFSTQLKMAGFVVLCLLPLMMKRASFPSLYQKQNWEGTRRYEFQQVKNDFHLSGREKNLIFSMKDEGYLYYLGRYEFWSDKVQCFNTFEREDIKELLQRNDFLIVMDHSDIAREKLAELGYQLPTEQGERWAVRLEMLY